MNKILIAIFKTVLFIILQLNYKKDESLSVNH